MPYHCLDTAAPNKGNCCQELDRNPPGQLINELLEKLLSESHLHVEGKTLRSKSGHSHEAAASGLGMSMPTCRNKWEAHAQPLGLMQHFQCLSERVEAKAT